MTTELMKVYERGDEIGLLAMTETHDGVRICFLRMWDHDGPKPPRRIPEDELHREWKLLDFSVDIPQPGPRCCLRCGRMNFGPCISLTCIDVVPA